MSFEDQLGSVVSRLRSIEFAIYTIEKTLEVEKDKLKQAQADLHSIQQQLRPPLERS